MFFVQLEKLCRQNNTTPTTATKALGFSTGAMSQWKNGSSPRGNVIVEFSKYFNVSADYLLGLSDTPQKYESDFSFEELKLVQAFRNKPDMQNAVRQLLGLAKPDSETQIIKNA